MSIIKGKDQILEEIFEQLRSSIKENLPNFLYVTNMTESKSGTFYVYKHCSRESEFTLMNYFSYFCLLKNYSNYHFDFLVIKNEYICNTNSIF